MRNRVSMLESEALLAHNQILYCLSQPECRVLADDQTDQTLMNPFADPKHTDKPNFRPRDWPKDKSQRANSLFSNSSCPRNYRNELTMY